MQAQSMVPRQRLASLNDPVSRVTPGTLASTAKEQTKDAEPAKDTPKEPGKRTTQPYIPEDYAGYLGGGPFNRFALALKSGLANEIDWACARLAAATQRAPEEWGVAQYAPFLVEAVVSALSTSRRELQQVGRATTSVVADSGPAMHVKRAHERAELLATILYNVSQVGENAVQLAQDARVVIEATKWLHVSLVSASRVRCEVLDVLDVVVPHLPMQTDVSVGAWNDSVETRLWAELVRLMCTSDERSEVVGAVRVLVQAISWHPHVARSIFELQAPRGVPLRAPTGRVISSRAAELVLSADADVVSAALELLLNVVRVEAMARALDAERESTRRVGNSPAESGTRTPVFGLRAPTRAEETESSQSMLPDGLVSLVALVLQQWMASVCPPPSVPPPLTASTAEGAKAAQTTRPPTEPELREACTWVLLNYEFIAPAQGQQRPIYVSINDMFSRYTVAKQGQTAPRVGRSLTMSEIVRVVAAVFPRASVQNVNVPQRAPGQATETTVALHLRQKTPHIVPIPELPPAPSDTAAKDTSVCGWTGCTHVFGGEEEAVRHLHEHVKGADACRWRSCNRIPRENAELGEIEPWLTRHILTHGPFVKQAAEAKSDLKPELVQLSRGDTEKLSVLDLISPPFADSEQQQQVLRLVLQGVGVVEQLQRWADRRVGMRGERDRVRVWRCGDDVLERVAFIAAQNTPVAAYAARLLAAISKQNVT
ncbi:hypothetical protein IW142_003904 [Coemansia sp. RSA 564]|nr:hypothetical protein IW142_003904 [Coemansia sp. RSA 564]KAJ2153081.1 hypothetical protein J3F82_002228 [Coemansia sp. RSA 637]KAJ2725030.1 hypothetical protein H4S00_002148 [Coemansia sp. D1744]KAJ2837294.1 hypothetical protein J3B01_002225 [Coemansia erecta]